MLDAARASAREEGRQLIENAQKEADKVIRKAGEDARREKDKMLEQAKHEILSLVLDAAAGSMNKKSDDSALYDEFLKKAGTTEMKKLDVYLQEIKRRKISVEICSMRLRYWLRHRSFRRA